MKFPSIPPGIPANIATYLRSVAQYVEMSLRPPAAPPTNVRVSAPDGSVWEIRVSNSGTITATKVSDG